LLNAFLTGSFRHKFIESVRKAELNSLLIYSVRGYRAMMERARESEGELRPRAAQELRDNFSCFAENTTSATGQEYLFDVGIRQIISPLILKSSNKSPL
jgi:hypothetical protein